MVNFPTSLDSYQRPSASDTMDTSGVTGPEVIDNAFDSIEALEAKVGVDSSAVETSHSYKLGDITGADKALGKSAAQTVTNKTFTAPVINGGTVTSATIASATVTNPTTTGTDIGAEIFQNKSLSTGTSMASNIDSNITYYGIARQGVINGGCLVNQQVTVPTISSTYQYAPVDMFAAKATGTAVSAGTITQATTATAGTTGYALKLSGVTLTGSGIVYVRYRMESKDALAFKNQAASFGVSVYHDAGIALNYVIYINKPTAADDYTSTAAIVNSGNISVSSATKTTIKLENINSGNIGDTSNGLEIEIQVSCGAITTKNFEFADWQFNKGAVLLPFQSQRFSEELRAALRYYEKSYAYGTAPGTATSTGQKTLQLHAAATGFIRLTTNYTIAKRTNTAPTIYDSAGASGKVDYDFVANKAGTVTVPSDKCFDVFTDGVTSKQSLSFQYVSDQRL